MNDDGRLRQRAWYFSKIYADPKSVDTRLRPQHRHAQIDRRRQDVQPRPRTHGDHHGLWIDPTDPDRLINANDGGASVSLDGGKTWSTQDNQPTGSVLSRRHRQPLSLYRVYGAQQDNTNLAIASFDDEGVIGPRDWYPAGGGESRIRRPRSAEPGDHL